MILLVAYFFTEMAASESQSVSPAPSIVSTSHGTLLGRLLKSAVWKFFEYNAQIEKSVCQVIKSNSSADAALDQVCGHCIAGKYPSNLKQHLRKHHPQQYSEVLKLEEAAKKAKEEAESKKCARSLKTAKQLTLTQSLSTGTTYKKDSEQHKLLTRKLAVFVGSSNVANRIVESLEFRDLLHCLDHRYQVPGRAAVKKELLQVMIELKAKVSSYIQEANKVSICADIWSKKA